MKSGFSKFGHWLCFIVFVQLPAGLFAAGTVRQIEIVNDWEIHKQDEPVVVGLKDIDIDFDVRSVRVWDGEREIASQLDDLDGNGLADELVFVADIPPRSRKELRIEFFSVDKPNDYTFRVYAEMLISDPKGKHIPVRSLTVPASSYVYDHLHHHGPAFESELVAYRIYFDKKQTVDIYGKFTKRLEIEKSQFYPTDEQLAQGYGDDVLLVGNSCGLGTLKGWDGVQATHIENAEAFSETICAYGPIRTVVDVRSHHWKYQGSDLQMTIRYILYAGHRDCEVQVYFSEPLKKEVFSTGLLKMKDSRSYSDHKGTLACWGTDWPVGDTVKYAKDTGGLAISLPDDLIRQETEDRYNDLYIIQAEGRCSFSYHIVFTSMKESFGYKDADAWFEYVRQWTEGLKKKCHVKIWKNSIDNKYEGD